MFQSYLEYGISAAQSSNPQNSYRKRQIAQYQFPPDNAHTDPLFKAHVNNVMYQYHNSDLPTSLSNLFTRNNNIHNHRTRHRNHPHFTHRRTALTAQSIIYKGPKLWQTIPQLTKNCKTIYSFSRNIKHHIIQNY